MTSNLKANISVNLTSVVIKRYQLESKITNHKSVFTQPK